jgi:hypothetical protein
MPISRYIVVAVPQVLQGIRAVARAAAERAEAEVAVGDEGAHAARFGEGHRLTVVGLATLSVELVGMGRDVAEQMLRVGRESVVRSLSSPPPHRTSSG